MAATNKCLAQRNKSCAGWSTKPMNGGQLALSGVILRGTTMAEQPVNQSTVLYLGVFSRAEQRVLQAIFKGIAEGHGRCGRYPRNACPRLEHQQVNHAQRDRPSGR